MLKLKTDHFVNGCRWHLSLIWTCYLKLTRFETGTKYNCFDEPSANYQTAPLAYHLVDTSSTTSA